MGDPTPTWLYILTFIQIRSGVRSLGVVENWPSALLWLVAFTTACTTVRAVILPLITKVKLPACMWPHTNCNERRNSSCIVTLRHGMLFKASPHNYECCQPPYKYGARGKGGAPRYSEQSSVAGMAMVDSIGLHAVCHIVNLLHEVSSSHTARVRVL